MSRSATFITRVAPRPARRDHARATCCSCRADSAPPRAAPRGGRRRAHCSGPTSWRPRSRRPLTRRAGRNPGATECRPAAAGAGARARHRSALRGAICRRRCGGASARAMPGCGSTGPPARRTPTAACWRARATGSASAELLLERRQLPRRRGHPPGLGAGDARAGQRQSRLWRVRAPERRGRGRGNPTRRATSSWSTASGGNRLWLVPSMHIAILCTADAPRARATGTMPAFRTSSSRGARDFVPPSARPGADSRRSFRATR